MRILSIDPGRTMGIVHWDDKPLLKDEYQYSGPLNFYEHLSFLMDRFSPEIIVHGTPVRYPAVLALQSKQIGIIELLAEKHGIATIPVIDNSAKKTVLGNGKVKKPEIMAFYNETVEHIADCLMFIDYFLSYQK